MKIKTATWITSATCCLLWTGHLQSILAAHILFFVHINNYSHRLTIWPLAEALAARGHNVTFIAGYYPKEPNPNITELVPAQMADFLANIQKTEFDVNVRTSNAQVLMLHNLFDYGFRGCELLYDSPEFQTWMRSHPVVDLVFADHCVCLECAFGVAYKLGAKYAAFTTLPAFPYEYDTFGYLPESGVIPEMDVRSPALPMGFFTRVGNALMSLRWRWQYFRYSHRMDRLIRDKLGMGEDMPFITELVAHASLIFSTADVITDYPRTLPPNHVNIAGLHLKEETRPLPLEIENFLQNGESDGLVYISLGSLVNPSNLPQNIQRVFFQVIRSLPHLKFLWKWNDNFPKDAPNNVLFSRWFPQSDILAAEVTRAFVTQGGRPSTAEAMWHGVPMISFPILADQDYNANRLEEWGVTTKLEIGQVTEEEFRDAIVKAVYEPTMRTKMRDLQKRYRDRPTSPMETAVWWTEYVLRSSDTSHLRPAGSGQYWFVRRQIDVWAFITTCFIVFIICTLKLTKVVWLRSRKNKKWKSS